MAVSLEVGGWRAELDGLPARFGRLFVRAEPRRQAGRYLEGRLGPVERKNGWRGPPGTSARRAPGAHPAGARPRAVGRGGRRRPRPVPRAGRRAPGGAGRRAGDRRDRLREEGRALGRRGAAVRRHRRRKDENRRVGVLPAYGGRGGGARPDRPPAGSTCPRGGPAMPGGDARPRSRTGSRSGPSPRSRARDARPRPRRRRAVRAGGVPGDGVYGADRRLRTMPEGRGRPHVLAIRGNDELGAEPEGGGVGRHASGRRARALPPRAWRRRGAGAERAQGPRGDKGRAAPESDAPARGDS